MTEEAAVEDFIQGYGLRLAEEGRKWWQPQFEIVAMVHTLAGGECMGARTDHVSWHWTFRQGRDRLNVLHGELIQKAMVDSWYGSQVRDPDGPPIGFDGNVS